MRAPLYTHDLETEVKSKASSSLEEVRGKYLENSALAERKPPRKVFGLTLRLIGVTGSFTFILFRVQAATV